jgi:hypothetical protein
MRLYVAIGGTATPQPLRKKALSIQITQRLWQIFSGLNDLHFYLLMMTANSSIMVFSPIEMGPPSARI